MRTNHNASGKPSLEGCVGLRYLLRWVLQATYPWVRGILTEEKKGKGKKKVYDYPQLNGDLNTLRTKLKEYYVSHIKEKMFKYQLIK